MENHFHALLLFLLTGLINNLDHPGLSVAAPLISKSLGLIFSSFFVG